jgi:hypothetical protein
MVVDFYGLRWFQTSFWVRMSWIPTELDSTASKAYMILLKHKQLVVKVAIRVGSSCW